MSGVEPFRSGFVGLIGRPNVGKSTMLNYYVGERVAIVSPHPQTTRTRIVGILTRPDAQVCFIDAPGVHRPQHSLGRHMAGITDAVIEEADVLVVVVDGRAGLREEDRRVLERVRTTRHPILVAINKVDIAQKPRILPVIEACAATGIGEAYVPVSAKTGDQMDVLLAQVIARLPHGPRWYEPPQRTDQTTPQRISELIREQALLATRQEVPYAVAVQLDQIEEEATATVIHATVVVERPGHKGILIGQGGQRLKRITQAARKAIKRLLGRPVALRLWVKVVEDWRTAPRTLRELGYTGGPP